MMPRQPCVACGESCYPARNDVGGQFCSDVCSKRRSEDLRLAERELAGNWRPDDGEQAEAMLSRARLLCCTWYATRRRRGLMSHIGLDGWVTEFWDDSPPVLEPPADAAAGALARRVEWLTSVVANERESTRRRLAQERATVDASRWARRVADDDAAWRGALGGDR